MPYSRAGRAACSIGEIIIGGSVSHKSNKVGHSSRFLLRPARPQPITIKRPNANVRPRLSLKSIKAVSPVVHQAPISFINFKEVMNSFVYCLVSCSLHLSCGFGDNIEI